MSAIGSEIQLDEDVHKGKYIPWINHSVDLDVSIRPYIYNIFTVSTHHKNESLVMKVRNTRTIGKCADHFGIDVG